VLSTQKNVLLYNEVLNFPASNVLRCHGFRYEGRTYKQERLPQQQPQPGQHPVL
jgi:hypothetical protein